MGIEIEITIASIKGDQVKIGINAPKHIEIHRKEIYLEIQSENEEAVKEISGLFGTSQSFKKRINFFFFFVKV